MAKKKTRRGGSSISVRDAAAGQLPVTAAVVPPSVPLAAPMAKANVPPEKAINAPKKGVLRFRLSEEEITPPPVFPLLLDGPSPPAVDAFATEENHISIEAIRQEIAEIAAIIKEQRQEIDENHKKMDENREKNDENHRKNDENRKEIVSMRQKMEAMRQEHRQEIANTRKEHRHAMATITMGQRQKILSNINRPQSSSDASCTSGPHMSDHPPHASSSSSPSHHQWPFGEYVPQLSLKKVRFDVEKNLLWGPENPLPPQKLRIPPSAKPRGSALKKGVPLGPIDFVQLQAIEDEDQNN